MASVTRLALSSVTSARQPLYAKRGFRTRRVHDFLIIWTLFFFVTKTADRLNCLFYGIKFVEILQSNWCSFHLWNKKQRIPWKKKNRGEEKTTKSLNFLPIFTSCFFLTRYHSNSAHKRNMEILKRLYFQELREIFY